MKRAAFVALLLLALATAAIGSTGERIAVGLKQLGLSRELVVLVIAMLPVVELRGALPVGINLFGLGLARTLLLAIVGNMLPIFLVVLLLEQITSWLGRFRLFRRFFDWLFARTRSKSGMIARYEFWGLVIFVGIPLPGTGAWTGSIAAALLGMSYWRSLLAIFIGVLLAAALVTALCLLGWWGALVAGLVFAGFAVRGLWVGRRRQSQSNTPS